MQHSERERGGGGHISHKIKTGTIEYYCSFTMLGFQSGGKPEHSEKNPQSKENQQQT